MGLIDSRGHFPGGGYCVQDGTKRGSGPGRQGKRRQFTDEFEAGAVRLVLDEGKMVAQVARDLDLTPSALSGWVKQARADRSRGKTGVRSEERAELAALRKELRVVKMERDSGQGYLLSRPLAFDALLDLLAEQTA